MRPGERKPPLTTAEIRALIEDRSIPEPNSGCWLWLGAPRPDGYGQVGFKQHRDGAHRVSYAAFNGPIPQGAVIMHTCDQPLCVNPEHLKVGSWRDNTLDMVRKGRRKAPSSQRRRVSRELAVAMAARWEPGSRTNGIKALAREHGLHVTTVRAAINRQLRRSLSSEERQ